LPQIIAERSASFEITFRADYVANSRDGVSNVHANGAWNAKIPEKILRAWFKQADAGASTLYGLLSVDEKASGAEIKSAYRRAARLWHPDVCREENAREMFEKIKEAYDVLSDQLRRNKYNAGLAFERMAKLSPRASKFASFVPMMRCGDLKVIAKKELGQLIVEEILEWRDITDEFGRQMVSYWDGDSYSVKWI